MKHEHKKWKNFCFPRGGFASSWVLPWSQIVRDEWQGRGSEDKRMQTEFPCAHEAVESLQRSDFKILEIVSF